MKTAHDVKLLNGSKQEVTYPGVETVTMPGTDGQDKVFTAGAPIDALDISPDFSGGDMPLEAPEGYVVRGATIKKPDGAEQVIAKGQTVAGIAGEYVTPGTAKEIEPNFSEGDQTVTAEGDERWSEVTVKKPDGLVPENIVKDVEIAGVVGAFEATDIAGLIDGTISEISDEMVKSVRACAFSGCKNLSTVSFPMCETVGYDAFYSCSSLNSVYLPMCDKIGTSAFYGCSMLSDYVFSDVIHSIGLNAFGGTPVLKFEDGVAYLNNAAFSTERNTKVSSAVLRDGTTLIADYTFYGNSYINRVSGNEVFQIGKYAFSGCSKLTNASFPVCESIESYAFYYCSSLTAIDARACKYVGNSAFYYATKLESISFPECGQIANYAFVVCQSLSTVHLPKCGIIGDNAFSGCTRLSSVVFSDKLTSVGYRAFYGTPILNSFTDGICYLNNVVLSAKSFSTDVQLRSGTTLIAPYAFQSNSAITFSVHGSEVTQIGEAAFSNCRSMSYVSFSACESIGGWAFYYCSNLKSADFPLCKTIGNSAFAFCSNLSFTSLPVCSTIEQGAFYYDSYLTSIYIPECSYISNEAFSGCSRLRTVIADKCEMIGDNAFRGCYSITNATLPACKTIGSWAFYSCSKLVSMYLLGSSVPLLSNMYAFSHTPMDGSIPSGRIFVRESMVSAFVAAENWSIYSAAFSGLTDAEITALGGTP